MPSVAILVRSVPHHRVRFYELLRESLCDRGVELRLFAGQLEGEDAKKADTVRIAWAQFVPNRVLRVGGRELYYQPCLRQAMCSDLVIVIQESKLLINYVLVALRYLGLVKIALWGHGRSFKMETASRAGESIKRWMSRRVDWWFAYTPGSRRIVEEIGFPADRITVVGNSIDSAKLVELRAELSPGDIDEARARFGVSGGNVCLYAGSLYREKKVGTLLEAASRIREEIADFELLVVGAGAESGIVERFAAENHWVRHVGPLYGRDLVLAFELSKLLLIPGAIGLSVIDSFALGTPLVTTQEQAHGPEIEYLEPGGNGWIVPGGDDPERYAKDVAHLLRDGALRNRLIDGCSRSSREYSIETMAANFAAGVLSALKREHFSEI